MAEVLKSVDLRTQLAGHNRLELLLFRLQTPQRYGINVFKVREVIPSPKLTKMPMSMEAVLGVAHLRGQTISVIDLNRTLGGAAIKRPEKGFLVITEYNRKVQGFLVDEVDRIINLKWDEILSPPSGLSGRSYLTAVTHVDNEIVQVIDVEKILEEIRGSTSGVSDETKSKGQAITEQEKYILVVDDSAVARKQIIRTMDQLGVKYSVARNGREALEMLKDWAANDPTKFASLDMVLSDIEMPEMDGYTLTKEIRNAPELQQLYVLLHSSLSGVFNQSMVEKVGANEFIAKFSAEDLARTVLAHLEIQGAAPQAA